MSARSGSKMRSEYYSWRDMRRRCLSPRAINYANYGGRGIAVCERWSTFAQFLADMGPRPTPDHSVDRIDNTKGYSPENCRWATRVEQTRNRRTTCVLTHNGVSRTLIEWAQALGMTYPTLSARIHKLGWTVERALTTPVTGRSRIRAATIEALS